MVWPTQEGEAARGLVVSGEFTSLMYLNLKYLGVLLKIRFFVNILEHCINPQNNYLQKSNIYIYIFVKNARLKKYMYQAVTEQHFQ